jgi:fumarate reductase subunit D
VQPAEDTVIAMVIGVALLVIALIPGFKFYEGRLGTKQVLPSIEPAWIGRRLIFTAGLAAILDGIWEIHHR